MTPLDVLAEVDEAELNICCDAPDPQETASGWVCGNCRLPLDDDLLAFLTCQHEEAPDIGGHVVCTDCGATGCSHPESVPCLLAGLVEPVTPWRWSS